MTYSAGQVVEVCSGRSRRWTSGFKYGSKITLEKLIPPYEGYAGRWEAVTATGVRGIISEHDFRPVPEHSPVRTVPRLVPGVYGLLYVGSEVEGRPAKEVLVRIAPDHGPAMCAGAPELRELARVALEIAEYLENA